MSRSHGFYKSFASFVMNTANSIISILKIIVLSKSAPTLPKPVGDKLLILGNGPSLNDSLLKHKSYFEKHTLMCVNRFSISEHYTYFKPTVYVILDQNFWESQHEVITTAIDALVEKTTWPIDLIIPHTSKNSEMMKRIRTNPNIRICFFNYIVFKGFPGIAHFFYRKNLAMIQSRNVLLAAIFLGINLGYKRLEIFGADHNMHEQLHVDDNNVVHVRMVHFYDKEEVVTYIPFRKGLETDEVHRMDESLEIWARVFRGYHLLKDYAKSRGTEILNASEKSYVDAFRRISIDS